MEVGLIIKVWQAKSSDGDLLQEGPYSVELMSDADGPGGHLACLRDTLRLESHEETKHRVTVRDGGYLYLRIHETNGRDNPIGDGADETNNGSGHAGADGLRDDLDDSAWTTPIWFERQP